MCKLERMKKQNRRCVSLPRTLYDALQERAKAEGTTGSGLVEREMRRILGLEVRNLSVRPRASGRMRTEKKPDAVPVLPVKEGFPTPTYSVTL
jgi:hypothetical protein